MIKLPTEYKTRPPASGFDQVSRMHGRFKGIGLVMPESQRKIYENLVEELRNRVRSYRGYPKTIHKPTIVDVGCGTGIGSNILSREAQFVWGIDVEDELVEFCKQMFERPSSDNVYYTPQLTFDVVNALDEPRELQTFDLIACIEVIEHLPLDKTDQFLHFLNRFFKRTKRGEYDERDGMRSVLYLTTPNRNSPKLQDDTPYNDHHCFEATAGEMYEYLTQHYKAVTVLDENMKPQELDTTASPLVYKLEMPHGELVYTDR